MTDKEHARMILRQYKKVASVILNEQASRNDARSMLKILDKMIASDYVLFPSAQKHIALVWRLVGNGVAAFENRHESDALLRTRLRLIVAVCQREIEDTLDEHGIPF